MAPPIPTRPRRIAYLGSPPLAVPPLRAVLDAGYEVPLVVSQPDRRRGRGRSHQPTAVKAAALEVGIPVTERVDDLLGAALDLGVVVAFGRLIRPHVLEAVPLVNLHFSLLPRWRGAAPVERAILAGDRVTGVCLMEVAEELDAGGIYASREVPVGEEDTLEELQARLVAVGTELLLDRLANGFGNPVPQQGEPTWAEKVTPEDLELRWERPAVELHRVVRLGRAWTTFRGKRLGVLAARVGVAEAPPPAPGVLAGTVVGTGEGVLELLEVRPEGRRALPAADWLRGARPEPGERLGG